MAKFDKSVLEKYGITGTTEVLYNPSYEVLFNEETKAGLKAMKLVRRQSLVRSMLRPESTPEDRLRISLSLMMRTHTTLFGGHPTNIRTTITVQAKRLGMP